MTKDFKFIIDNASITLSYLCRPSDIFSLSNLYARYLVPEFTFPLLDLCSTLRKSRTNGMVAIMGTPNDMIHMAMFGPHKIQSCTVYTYT